MSEENQNHGEESVAEATPEDSETRESNSVSSAEVVMLSEKSEEGACQTTHSWVMQLLNSLQPLDVILSGQLFHCGTPLKFPEIGAELPFKEIEAEICEQIRSKLSEVPELAEAILSVSVQSLTRTESGGIKAKIHVRYDATKLRQYENPCDLIEIHQNLKFHSVINGTLNTFRNMRQRKFFGNVCKNGQVCDWNESYADEHSERAKRTKNELESQITNALSSNSMFVVNKVTCELKEAVESDESQLNAVICLQLGGTDLMNSMSKEDLIKTLLNSLQPLDVILSGQLFHCGTPLKFPEIGAELPFKEIEAEICEQIRSKLSEVPELAEAILSVSVQSLTRTEFFGNVCKNGQVCDWNESYADEHSESAKRTKNELESQITNALSSNSMFVVNKVTCELKEAVESDESQLNAVICLQLGGTDLMNSMSKEDLIKTVRNLVFEEGLRQMWKERHSILQFTLEKT
ncbi:hypothetical protein AHF37_07835 [Paragonimus kellicotti]|nr:hypothetical protein AHF37_07835 [Paragonimus kellicotti]